MGRGEKCSIANLGLRIGKTDDRKLKWEGGMRKAEECSIADWKDRNETSKDRMKKSLQKIVTDTLEPLVMEYTCSPW